MYDLPVLMVIISQANILVSAEISFTVEAIYEPNELPLICDGRRPPDVVEINGVKYFWRSLQEGSHPVKYTPETYDFFMGLNYATYDCIFTGDYYMIRSNSLDHNGWANGRYGADVNFYDTEFNLVHQAYFERYVLSIGYYDGTYYCEEYNNGIKVSTDMVNWFKQTGFFPRQIGNVTYNEVNPSLPYNSPDATISINGSTFMQPAYEGVKGI